MNDIYTLFNQVKTDPSLFKREDLNEMEIMKLKKYVKTQGKIKYKSRSAMRAACAVIAVLLIGNTVFAEELQLAAKSIGWHIEKYLGIEKDLQDYITVLNTSQTHKGFTITLNEVILDDKELIVSSTIRSEKPVDSNGMMASADVYVNGKCVLGSSSGSSKDLDQYTTEEVMGYNLDDIDTSQNLELEIVYREIRLGQSSVKGHWDFQFAADGKALAANTQQIPLDICYQLPNGAVIKLSKYTSNDLGDKIYFEIPSQPKTKGLQYDMELKGNDDLGNEISFYLSNANGEKGTGCFVAEDSIDNKAVRLTLKPYAVKYPEKSGKLSNDFKPSGEEFTILRTGE